MTAAETATGGSSGRPWRRAALALLGLGLLFYSSYGFANWLAGLRDHVPSIVFGWEAAVPFLAWTIVPYWTTNLFYAGSLFLCADGHELGVHIRRLLTTQLVAIAVFVALPLKFSWPKPDTSGAFGVFFDSLGAFDRPFNQAPSLHVALTIVLAALWLRHLPRALGPVFLGWSGLVVASTMTTWQHHFIDLPTGALLGLAVLWAWPMAGPSPLARAHLTTDPDRRRLARRWGLGAIAVAGVGIGLGGWGLWLLWPAVALALVAAAHAALGPAAFAKSADGRIPLPVRVLLAPVIVGALVNSRAWTCGEPRRVAVTERLFLGRFPAAADLAGIATVIDLTTEFPRPHGRVHWHAIPMLDLVAPDPARLRQAADRALAAEADGPVLVCCALGYGRSVATLAVALVRSGRAATIAEALAHLRTLRPRLAPTAAQIAAMEAAAHD